jgi:hypothetical protein
MSNGVQSISSRHIVRLKMLSAYKNYLSSCECKYICKNPAVEAYDSYTHLKTDGGNDNIPPIAKDLPRY